MGVIPSAVAWLPVAALLMTGCVPAPPPEPVEETRTVPLGKAEMVNVRIEMKGGELDVSGGAQELLHGFFSYRSEGWKPEVSYSEAGFRGNLLVRQSGVRYTIGPQGGFRNEWRLKLSNTVPMDLEVKLGAGRTEMDLAGLHLRSLEVHLGAGELDLNLAGQWRKSFEARIRGGVGKATVRLPKDVGVEARARGGIGAIHTSGLKREGRHWVNDALGSSPVTLRIDVEGGIGEIRLETES